jgi:hypothetical protein
VEPSTETEGGHKKGTYYGIKFQDFKKLSTSPSLIESFQYANAAKRSTRQESCVE